MVFNLCVQNVWTAISAIMPMAKENDKILHWITVRKCQRAFLSVNQGLFHRIEQKDHELYFLLPSLQPTTLPTALF